MNAKQENWLSTYLAAREIVDNASAHNVTDDADYQSQPEPQPQPA